MPVIDAKAYAQTTARGLSPEQVDDLIKELRAFGTPIRSPRQAAITALERMLPDYAQAGEFNTIREIIDTVEVLQR